MLPSYNEQYCYDSDGGQNYEEKGTTYGKRYSLNRELSNPNIRTKFEDYCEGPELVEYYCDGNKVKNETVDCGYGSYCENGKCIESTFCPPTFPSLSEDEYTEKIVFAVNEEYALYNPNWEYGAQEVIDYVNEVLAKTTEKNYEIEKFMTYETEEYESLPFNEDYYTLTDGYESGTTLFFYVPIENNSIASDPPQNVLDSGKVNVAYYSIIDGIKYNSIWIVGGAAGYSLLEGQEVAIQKNISYDQRMMTTLHELGHTLGLAYGEWYSYEFDDETNVLPYLGMYDYRYDIYPNDPMCAGNSEDWEFSSFNSAIINKNTKYTYNFIQIATYHAQKPIVKVVGENGKSIPNATVKVFGAKKNCFYCNEFDMSEPLQILETDSNGEVEIDNISAAWHLSEAEDTGWSAKIIKASDGNKHGGTVFTLVDSQESCITDGHDVHYIYITLE